MGLGWWQASDGMYYPPESHPRYGKRPEPGLGFTVVSAKRDPRKYWIAAAVVLVLGIGVGGKLFADSVANQGRAATADRARRIREEAEANQRAIDEAMDELDDELDDPGAGPGTGTSDGDGIGEHTPIDLTQAATVFEDDFADPSTGWVVGDLDGAGTAEFVIGGYDVTAHSEVPWLARSPSLDSYTQMAFSAIVSISPGATGGAVGVRCSGTDEPTTVYSLEVDGAGAWTLTTSDTDRAGDPTPVELAHDDTGGPVGDELVELQLVCAAQPDGVTTRVVAALDGIAVADVLDESDALGEGWVGAVSVEGDGTRAHVQRYEELDLNG
jgi:hypothetical protein